MSRPAISAYSFLSANLKGEVANFPERQATRSQVRALPPPSDWADPIEPVFKLFPEDEGFTVCQAIEANIEYYSIQTRELIRRPWLQHQWRWSWLKSILRGARGQLNQYVSQNSMDGHRGNGPKSICQVWADIDFYKIDNLRGLAPTDAFPIIRDHLTRAGLPAPTYAVDSGRGLYFKWLLNAPLSGRDHATMQTAVNRRIVDVLEPFGADAKSVDTKRVLRVCGSLHRDGWTVRIIPASWTGALYDLDALARRFGASATFPAVTAPIRRGWQAPIYDLTGKPVDRARVLAGNRRSIRDYNAAVLADIVTLYRARGGLEAATRDKRRDAYAFAAAVFIVLQNPQSARSQSLAFIDELGLEAAEFAPMLATALARAERHLAGERIVIEGVSYDPRYTPKKATVLAWLGVTNDEAVRLQLKALVPRAVKRGRATAALQQKRRAAGVRPRSEYAAKAEQARTMSAKGVRPVEIARQLGMTADGVRKAIRRGGTRRSVAVSRETDFKIRESGFLK